MKPEEALERAIDYIRHLHRLVHIDLADISRQGADDRQPLALQAAIALEEEENDAFDHMAKALRVWEQDTAIFLLEMERYGYKG